MTVWLFFSFIKPQFSILKTLNLSYIIDNYSTNGTPIVWSRDWLKWFLSSLKFKFKSKGPLIIFRLSMDYNKYIYKTVSQIDNFIFKSSTLIILVPNST